MGYCLLGTHVNMTINGLPEIIEEWKPPLVVILDHSDIWYRVKANTPNTIFVGRLIREHEPDFNDRALDPVVTARNHCETVLAWAERMAEAYDFWQGVNEPVVGSPEAMRRYAAFEVERVQILARHGFRAVVGTFSVGNPHLPYWRHFLPALEAALQYDGALALHEYAWPSLDHEPEWYSLRHRKVYHGEPAHNWKGLPKHLKALPLLITECGLDGLLEQPYPPRGWQALYTPDQYLEQLAWYDAELRKDPYVAGAAIFACGMIDWTWKSYDIWYEPARTLAREATPIYRLAEEQPAEPTEPPEPIDPPDPKPVWQVETEYRPGARIIAGSLPEPGIDIMVSDPWGNATRTTSGAKLEYGPGGFEVLTPHTTTYTVAFLGESFGILTHDGATIVTFRKDGIAAQTQPLPPAFSSDELDQLLERLDWIIDRLETRLESR
ncbi:MAG: hypothetical protein ACP5JJ_02460 [Anaerolineae bacterium]